jgi:hypothetical protein
MALGDLELDCYVLSYGRSVFHKRGMAKALGLKSAGGNAFMKTISRKGVGSNISSELRPTRSEHRKLVGPLGLEPRTKGFTAPHRFRWEWTISSPLWGAGRSSLLLSAPLALR